MDSIDAKYKLAMNDLRKWHKDVFLTQVNKSIVYIQTERLVPKLDMPSFGL
jgi:hypothetical protein